MSKLQSDKADMNHKGHNNIDEYQVCKMKHQNALLPNWPIIVILGTSELPLPDKVVSRLVNRVEVSKVTE